MKSNKAQMSIEMIIILSILILVGIIVAGLILSATDSNLDVQEKLDDQMQGTTDHFIEQVENTESNVVYSENVTVMPIDKD